MHLCLRGLLLAECASGICFLLNHSNVHLITMGSANAAHLGTEACLTEQLRKVKVCRSLANLYFSIVFLKISVLFFANQKHFWGHF